LENTRPVLKWAKYPLAGSLIALVVVFAVLRFTVLSYWTIPQNGMYPTLPAGARFFGINKPYRSAADVKRGDIVVFEQPDGGNRYIYLWRVVGLPGDSVEIEDSRVSLNGKALPLEKVRSEGNYDIFRETNGGASYEVADDRAATQRAPGEYAATVPQGHLFVLGDNRVQARDSRVMGPIPISSVLAKKW
jgi:signal peptidase I